MVKIIIKTPREDLVASRLEEISKKQINNYKDYKNDLSARELGDLILQKIKKRSKFLSFCLKLFHPILAFIWRRFG